MPVIIAGNEEQKKKYLGRMTEEPLMCVSLEWHYKLLVLLDLIFLLSAVLKHKNCELYINN